MRLVLFIAVLAFAGDAPPAPLSPADSNKILQAENAVLKFQNAAHQETARYQREMVRLGQMEQQARKEYDAAVVATKPKDCEACQFNAQSMTWTRTALTTPAPAVP